MSRYIDADRLFEKLCDNSEMGWDDIETVLQVFNHAPTVDAEPIRHGHWIDCKGRNGKDYRKCSECLHTQEITGLLNYCPVCGVKMESEHETD